MIHAEEMEMKEALFLHCRAASYPYDMIAVL